jgi:hypothetical protein
MAQVGVTRCIQRPLSLLRHFVMESDGKSRDWQTIAHELGLETNQERIVLLVKELEEAMERANPYSRYTIDPQKKPA